VEPAEIAKAADLYGLGRPVETPVVSGRGKQGVLWRLVTDAGPFAVKEVLDPVTEAEVAADVAFVTEMVGRGVHAPRPLRTLDGAVLADVGGGTVRVSTWVDLHDARPDLDPVALGRLVATLHADPVPVVVPGSAADAWYTDPVPQPQWQRATADLRAAGAPFAADFAVVAEQLFALQDLFVPPTGLRTCHRDLWADNVRGTPGGRLCVIDWDNAGPQDPSHEVCVALVEFCLGAPDRVAAFFAAYRAAGGTGRPSERGHFTMVLAQFGHFAIAAADDWLQATDDAARADAQSWFAELVDHPLDLAAVDLLLCAVRDA
jgi:Ser/Thr protein kinase RdoA (MazF antagonist)